MSLLSKVFDKVTANTVNADEVDIGGHYFQTFFESLDGLRQSTSGSGVVEIRVSDGIQVTTGTTDGSHASAALRRGSFVGGATWNKDKVAKFTVDITDTGGPLHAVTGVVSDSDKTTEHVGFRVTAGGDLEGTVADGTTQNTTTLITGVGTGLRDLRVVFTAGSDVQFYVDGTNEGSVSSNLPTGTSNVDPYTLLAENTNNDRAIIRSSEIRVHQP